MLGMEIVAFGDQPATTRTREYFEAEKPTPGSADVCFITSVSLSDVIGHAFFVV